MKEKLEYVMDYLFRITYTAITLREHPEYFTKKELQIIKPCLQKEHWPITLDVLGNHRLMGVIHEWFEENFEPVMSHLLSKGSYSLQAQKELMCIALVSNPDTYVRRVAANWMREKISESLPKDVIEKHQKQINNLK